MTTQEHLDRSNSEHKAAVRRAELECKSTEELFTASIAREYDDDDAWEAVTVLRLRGTSEVFEAAKRCCRSENSIARARFCWTIWSPTAGTATGMPQKKF
jgi:hypothetical protein